MLGRYKIVRRIALGGMAELYLAYATGLDGFEKLIAIKRVQPAFAADPDFVTMFLDEARTAATLSHPNIAQVHDVGVDGHSYFLAMEFVDGRDVRHLLREAIGRDQKMPLPIAVAIAGAVCAGLHAAHENRAPDRAPLHIVHRDVSPGNVLVTFGGAVKLIDFGIAKAARRRTVTQAGQLKGKAGYMSPEQCTGGTIDRRSDIFSLGVMLYELTTTTRLYRGRDEYQIMRRIVHGAVKPPGLVVPSYPAELERIVLRALARDPEQRYQTARDLHLDLLRFAKSHGMEATEYDLAAYVQQLIPDEKAGSILDVALDDLEDSDVGEAPEVIISHDRAASMADTTMRPAEDALHTTIYVADAPELSRPSSVDRPSSVERVPSAQPAPMVAPASFRAWHALAVLIAGAILFAGGWYVAEVVCG